MLCVLQVTLCHSLVAEDDWAARLDLAKSLLRPGGLLAVCDLAQPTAQPATAAATSRWRRWRDSARVAFWAAARPRAQAPHQPAVMARLREITSEVHAEQAAASWPVARQPLRAAHFLYVGRVA